MHQNLYLDTNTPQQHNIWIWKVKMEGYVIMPACRNADNAVAEPEELNGRCRIFVMGYINNW